MPPRLRDIAIDAGVSVATASRVLNGSRPVGEDIKRRVLISATKRGYRPNMMARGLRLSRSFTIGLIIPSIANPFFTAIARAIEDTAIKAGYAVFICSSDQDLAKEGRYIDVLRDRMVDGAIVTIADAIRSDLSPLLQSGMPVVLVDRSLSGIENKVDTVFVDTRRGAYAAVEYLIQRGYKRIAMIGGPAAISTANEKMIGYRQALTDHGYDLDDALVINGEYTERGGCAAAQYLLGLPHPPDAVLVASNQMTLGFFTCLRERGIRVPQELAFVGFDDASWSSIAVPPITVVDQPTYDVGRIAAQMILERINDGQRLPRHEMLPTRLIIRGSC